MLHCFCFFFVCFPLFCISLQCSSFSLLAGVVLTPFAICEFAFLCCIVSSFAFVCCLVLFCLSIIVHLCNVQVYALMLHSYFSFVWLLFSLFLTRFPVCISSSPSFNFYPHPLLFRQSSQNAIPLLVYHSAIFFSKLPCISIFFIHFF